MTSGEMDLPVLDRILLHLRANDTGKEPKHPILLTQAGIAQSVGIERKHVPRAVRRLTEDGCIMLVLAHLAGHRQRRRLHRLTSIGLTHANELLDRLGFDQSATGAATALNAALTSHEAQKEDRIGLLLLEVAEDGVIDTDEARRLAIAATLLGIGEAELRSRIIATGAQVDASEPPPLSGEGATWLSCMEVAMEDGVVSEDERMLLHHMYSALGLDEVHVDAWLLSVLHDMMK